MCPRTWEPRHRGALVSFSRDLFQMLRVAKPFDIGLEASVPGFFPEQALPTNLDELVQRRDVGLSCAPFQQPPPSVQLVHEHMR